MKHQQETGDTIEGADGVGPALQVMVADDVEALREVVCGLLAASPGIEICAQASDGDQAVELALEMRPDAIILDLKMPRKDGITAAKEILAAWPDAKVIINSAYADNALVESAIAAGVIHYQTKDRRPSELIDILLQLRNEC
ncbi:MAG: response regulator [Acidimicrobiales bacterium]